MENDKRPSSNSGDIPPRRNAEYTSGYADPPSVQNPDKAQFDPQLTQLRLSLLNAMSDTETGSLVDIGCGVGSLLNCLSEMSDFVESEWNYVGIDYPDRLESCKRYGATLSFHERMHLVGIDDFYRDWISKRSLSKPHVVVIRNVFHELDIEKTARLVYLLATRMDTGEKVLVQDLLVLPQGERGKACWTKRHLVNAFTRCGFRNRVGQLEKSKSGNKWFNLILESVNPPPSFETVLDIVIEERKAQYEYWTLQDYIIENDFQERDRDVALIDFDCQHKHLGKQIAEAEGSVRRRNPLPPQYGHPEAFFGRKQEAAKILDRVLGASTTRSRSVTILRGASHSGKTSLLLHRVCARLESEFPSPIVFYCDSKSVFLSSHTDKLPPLEAYCAKGLREIAKIEVELLNVLEYSQDSSVLVASFWTSLLTLSRGRNIVLIVDNLDILVEELSDQGKASEADRILKFLSDVAKSGTGAVIVSTLSSALSDKIGHVFKGFAVDCESIDLGLSQRDLVEIMKDWLSDRQEWLEDAQLSAIDEVIDHFCRQFLGCFDGQEGCINPALLPFWFKTLDKLSISLNSREFSITECGMFPPTMIETVIEELCYNAVIASGVQSNFDVTDYDNPLIDLFRAGIGINESEGMILREISHPAQVQGARLYESLIKFGVLERCGCRKARLVNAKLLEHWTWCKNWTASEDERELSKILTSILIKAMLWEEENSAEALLSNDADLDSAIRLIHQWIRQFQPVRARLTPQYKILLKFVFESLHLNRPADFTVHTEHGKTTLFLMAVSTGQTDITHRWASRNTEYLFQTGTRGNTFALGCCFAEDLQLLKFGLEHKINVNTVNDEGWSPFLGATAFGLIDLMQELKNHGADTSCRLPSGSNACHIAAYNNHVEVLRFCVEELGIAPWETNEERQTPLSLAALVGATQTVSYLVAQSDQFHPICSDVIDNAVSSGSLETVKMLLESSALDIGIEKATYSYALRLPDLSIFRCLVEWNVDLILSDGDLSMSLLRSIPTGTQPEIEVFLVSQFAAHPRGLEQIYIFLRELILNSHKTRIETILGVPNVITGLGRRNLDLLCYTAKVANVETFNLVTDTLQRAKKLDGQTVDSGLIAAAEGGNICTIRLLLPRLIRYRYSENTVIADALSAAVEGGYVQVAFEILKSIQNIDMSQMIGKLINRFHRNASDLIVVGNIALHAEMPNLALSSFENAGLILEGPVGFRARIMRRYLQARLLIGMGDYVWSVGQQSAGVAKYREAFTMATAEVNMWTRDKTSLGLLCVVGKRITTAIEASTQESCDLMPLVDDIFAEYTRRFHTYPTDPVTGTEMKITG